MGNKSGKGKLEAEVLENIAHPENETSLRNMFIKFDKNNSGSLDQAEWAEFGKYLWKVVVEDSMDAGQQQVEAQKMQQREGMMEQMNVPGFMRKLNRGVGVGPTQHRDLGSLKEVVKPKDIDEWIGRMFQLADKDKGGSITYEEFRTFLQNESKAEAEKQKDNFVVASHDPAAEHQAKLKSFENAGMFSPGNKGLRQYHAVTTGPMAPMMADLNQPYKPGEINVPTMKMIEADPAMKARYDRDPATITRFATHQFDPAECQKIAAANPGLQEDWAGMVYRSQQAAQANFNAGGGVAGPTGQPLPQAMPMNAHNYPLQSGFSPM